MEIVTHFFTSLSRVLRLVNTGWSALFAGQTIGLGNLRGGKSGPDGRAKMKLEKWKSKLFLKCSQMANQYPTA